METSTINQLIESIAFLITAMIVIIFWSRAMAIKKQNSREIDLLMDCYFYRQIIEKYQFEMMGHEDNSMIGNLRREVQSELNYRSSKLSEPGRIKARLEELKSTNEQISQFVDKIHVG